jgi:glutamate--cysteine ligase
VRAFLRPACPQPSDPIGPGSRPLFARHVACGAKPRERWTVGPELELFGYERDTLERIGPEAVDAVLAGFEAHGAEPAFEDGRRVEATMAWGWVTVEPGGQIEFSGRNRASLAEIERDVRRFLEALAEISRELGVVFAASGFDPLRGAGEQRWYPKRRYAVMRPYFAVDGRRGWDMMCRTGAIQANVDFDSEPDLAAKFLVGNRLGPVVAAMFANSPLEAGRLSGFKSRRYAAWLETDRDRTGVSPASLSDDFTIGGFVDYAARVPMLFVRREGRYLDLAGRSFERFLEEGAGGEAPIFQDFADHLTTIFTEARLKQHVELRSADAGGVEALMAALAFWKGITHDAAALAGALALAPRLDAGGFRRLQGDVARRGLEAEAEGVRVVDVARAAVELAADGLGRAAPDESRYLGPLAASVRAGVCPADLVVRDFEGSWGRDPRRALEAMRVA